MSKRDFCLVITAAAMIFCFALQAHGQELSEHMAIMHPLVGVIWLGHYSNPEDAHIKHVVQWESILDGQAVRFTKRVDELSFSMETIYYWDNGEQHVSFLTVTNRGQLSKGVVNVDDGVIVLSGEQITAEGNTPFKTSYLIRDDGTLEDRFYLKRGVEWIERHLIVMTQMEVQE